MSTDKDKRIEKAEAAAAEVDSFVPMDADDYEIPTDLAQQIVQARGGGDAEISAEAAVAERVEQVNLRSLAARVAEARTREAYADKPEEERAALLARDEATARQRAERSERYVAAPAIAEPITPAAAPNRPAARPKAVDAMARSLTESVLQPQARH